MNIVNFRARRKSRAADAEEFADAGTRLDGPLAELEINGPGEEGNPAEQDDGNQDNQPPSQPPTPDSRARVGL